jgi:predicted acylesterase/phospholipase RssA
MKMNDITSCRNPHQEYQRRYSCQILLFVLIASSAICEVFSFNKCCNNNNWGMTKTHYKKRILQKYLENNTNEEKNNFPHSRYGLLLSKVSTEDAYIDNNPTNIDTARTSSSSLSTTTNTNIVFPGGGIFFYHQAGVVNFLREEGYDLSTCTFSGASAGALTATLTATNVDFYVATDLALKMAEEAGVWDRSNGLQGIWGPLIENWLDELLPSSCIESVQDRITLLVTPVPSFGKSKISNFEDRNDLIKCNMASVHLVSFLFLFLCVNKL